VRSVVTAVPSTSAAGSPVSGSNATITAWWVGRLEPALPGKSETSFVDSTLAEGR
jgi:hypothetical protein